MAIWSGASVSHALLHVKSVHHKAWVQRFMKLGRHEALTMRPPRASTSRTRVPFARPPMLGLQLISPTLAAGAGVTRIVSAPRLAAAAAASHPVRSDTQHSQQTLLVRPCPAAEGPRIYLASRQDHRSQDVEISSLMAVSGGDLQPFHSLSMSRITQAVDGSGKTKQSLGALACMPTTNDDNFHIPADAG